MRRIGGLYVKSGDTMKNIHTTMSEQF